MMAVLLSAALAEVEDGIGYVDKFTLEDGTELSVQVTHKTDWEYSTYQDTLVAEDIPVYTVTIPEGCENVLIYMTDAGKEAFGHGSALYSYAYIADSDSLDTTVYAKAIEIGDEYYTAPVIWDYSYAWELEDWSVGAILMFKVGDLPTPDQPVSGDVNGDKTVSVEDAILVLRHIANLDVLSGDALTAADANGDQAVDVNDAIAILKLIAGAN